MVPLFFLTPNSTILTPGRGSPLLSVTVPLISIPAADAARSEERRVGKEC